MDEAFQLQLSAVNAGYDLVATTIKIFGFQMQYKRLPSIEAKAEILAAIKKTSEYISLQACLLAIGLTAARYHHWMKRQVACMLDDQSSCPRIGMGPAAGQFSSGYAARHGLFHGRITSF